MIFPSCQDVATRTATAAEEPQRPRVGPPKQLVESVCHRVTASDSDRNCHPKTVHARHTAGDLAPRNGKSEYNKSFINVVAKT